MQTSKLEFVPIVLLQMEVDTLNANIAAIQRLPKSTSSFSSFCKHLDFVESSVHSTAPSVGEAIERLLAKYRNDDFDLLKIQDCRVERFYHTSGWCQRLTRSELLINFTLGIILANAMYLGIDAELNTAEFLLNAHMFFIIAENIFCCWFTFELVVRFGAFRAKRDCLRDGWFKFDAALVLLIVLETWALPLMVVCLGLERSGMPTGPLRLLRLLRLSRPRLMRSLPQLVTMVKGMFVASRAVASSLLMVIAMIYFYSIILQMMLKNVTPLQQHFGSLPRCMWTLLMDGTLMDNTGYVMNKIIAINTPLAFLACTLFLSFVLLSAMTVMNMLIGVLCEVVSTCAQEEKNEVLLRHFKKTVLSVLQAFDVEKDGMISKDELQNVLSDRKSRKLLEEIQIDVDYVAELQQMLFDAPISEVPLKVVMNMMLDCRGDIPVTFRHMAESHALMQWSKARSRPASESHHPCFMEKAFPCVMEKALEARLPQITSPRLPQITSKRLFV